MIEERSPTRRSAQGGRELARISARAGAWETPEHVSCVLAKPRRECLAGGPG